jgi:hypothetical protein
MAFSFLVAAFAGGVAGPAAAQSFVDAGVLTCRVSPSIGLLITSTKRLDCTFTPDLRPAEHYVGSISRFGLDVGITGEGIIVWGVLSSISSGFPIGALAGNYGGASAEASLIVGAGANLLLGGSNRSFALQPLSIQGQIGVNFAAGITALNLVYAG